MTGIVSWSRFAWWLVVVPGPLAELLIHSGRGVSGHEAGKNALWIPARQPADDDSASDGADAWDMLIRHLLDRLANPTNNDARGTGGENGLGSIHAIVSAGTIFGILIVGGICPGGVGIGGGR